MKTQINQLTNTSNTAGSARTRSSSVPVFENQTQPQTLALVGAETGATEMKNEKMTFWQMIKAGFAWAFGGALGWRFGNFVANQLGLVFRWITVGVGSYGLLYFVHAMNPHDAAAVQKPQVQQHKAVK